MNKPTTNPPYMRVFKPQKPEDVKPHPRLADIDAAQPRMITPNGVGNGVERQHGYGRGS